MTDLTTLTLGRRIQALRKEQGLTQEALAERMGVTAQAVSKWENDLSCPDIMSLPALAGHLHTTVDTLLTGKSSAESSPSVPAKRPEELIVRMAITAEDGTRITINLPFTVFRLASLHSLLTVSVGTKDGDVEMTDFLRTLSGMDFKHISQLIENGARGMLVDAEADDHLAIAVWVE